MAVTPLLSALRMAIPVLESLVEAPAEEVADRLRNLLNRARIGEDVDGEALILLRQRRYDRLRRFVSGLLTENDTYRSSSVSFAPKEVRDAEADIDAVGHVNAYVAAIGEDQPWSYPLSPNAEYVIRMHIGQPMHESLLDPVNTALTLPTPLGDGAWLRAVLDIDDVDTLVVKEFFLAGNGESFNCQCSYGTDHGTQCAPSPWTELSFLVPVGPPVITAHLIVYRDAVALHVQDIVMPVGHVNGTPSARLVSRLVSTLRDLEDLVGRSASVVLSEGSTSVTVNGLGFTSAPFKVTPGAADTAILNIRQVLYDVHLRHDGDNEVSRYDAHLGKPYDEFLTDLARLARYGSGLYTRLFNPQNPDETTPYSLPSLLRHEALFRGRPPILQVTDHDYTDHSVLWQSVYDLPVGSDPTAYEPCQSLSYLQDFLEAEQAPALCPFDEDHREAINVLCPWGFWGLSTFLEQPTDQIHRRKSRRHPTSCLLVAGPGLGPLDAEHEFQLQQRMGVTSIRPSKAISAIELAAELKGNDLDVAYFYCHCGYEHSAADAASDRFLSLNGYTVMAQDVISWAQSRIWPRNHWKSRPPLIILNGCHTSEYTARTLNSFVPAFTRWAGASGVLGTETTLHQSVANWAGEQIMADLWAGQSISSAIRRMRWRLLAKGNVMGFSYTPHCLANLYITSPEDQNVSSSQ